MVSPNGIRNVVQQLQTPLVRAMQSHIKNLSGPPVAVPPSVKSLPLPRVPRPDQPVIKPAATNAPPNFHPAGLPQKSVPAGIIRSNIYRAFGNHRETLLRYRDAAASIAHNLLDTNFTMRKQAISPLLHELKTSGVWRRHAMQASYLTRRLQEMHEKQDMVNDHLSRLAAGLEKDPSAGAELARQTYGLAYDAQPGTRTRLLTGLQTPFYPPHQEDGVGSCSFNSTAMYLHEYSLDILMGHVESLLLEKKLPLQGAHGVPPAVAPLNLNTSHFSAEYNWKIDAGGQCFIVGGTQESYGAVWEFPGMQAALRYLKVDKKTMASTVLAALKNMNLSEPVTEKQILEQICNALGKPELLQGALATRTGPEFVRMTSALVYTLGTGAELISGMLESHIRSLVREPATPAERAASAMGNSEKSSLEKTFFRLQTALSSAIAGNPELTEAADVYLMKIAQAMNRHFYRAYDPNLPQPSLAADGQSCKGGGILHYRDSPASATGHRIDSYVVLGEKLQKILQDAAAGNIRELTKRSGSEELVAAFRMLAANMQEIVRQDAASYLADFPLAGLKNHESPGYFTNLLTKAIYGKVNQYGTFLNKDGAMPTSADAAPMLGEICTALKATKSAYDKPVQFMMGEHAFLIDPAVFRPVLDGMTTLDDWMEKNLKVHALEFMDEVLDPYKLEETVDYLLAWTEDGGNRMQQKKQMLEHCKNAGNTMNELYEACMPIFSGADLAAIETRMTDLIKPLRFGNLGWRDDNSWRAEDTGSYKLISAIFNPISNQVEFRETTDTNEPGYRMGAHWLRAMEMIVPVPSGAVAHDASAKTQR